MSDDVEPDPFDGRIGADLHEAADRVDGAAVTRTAVAGAVQRRRRRAVRSRAIAGAAVALVLLGGLAVVAASGDGPVEQVSAGAPTTTTVGGCRLAGAAGDPAGWFRLSARQAAVLLEAGAITRSQADQRSTHAVLLVHADLQLLSDPPIAPIDRQLWDLGYEDSAGLDLLRSERLLTTEQESSIADGTAPVLDQSQVDRVFHRFPTLTAIAPGGQPFPSVNGTVTYAPFDDGEVGAESRSPSPRCGHRARAQTTTIVPTTTTTGTG